MIHMSSNSSALPGGRAKTASLEMVSSELFTLVVWTSLKIFRVFKKLVGRNKGLFWFRTHCPCCCTALAARWLTKPMV